MYGTEGIPVRRHPDDQARRDARQAGPSLADMDRFVAEVRADLARREAEVEQARQMRVMSDTLGELWEIRPEIREWTPDQVTWLLAEYTRGDAELAWLRNRKTRTPHTRLIAASIWSGIISLCRTVNGWAWPFQVLLCLAGLFVLGYLAGVL